MPRFTRPSSVLAMQKQYQHDDESAQVDLFLELLIF